MMIMFSLFTRCKLIFKIGTKVPWIDFLLVLLFKATMPQQCPTRLRGPSMQSKKRDNQLGIKPKCGQNRDFSCQKSHQWLRGCLSLKSILLGIKCKHAGPTA